MRHPEQIIHRSIGAYLDAVLPATAWWFHPANGGKRGKIEAAIFKSLGVRAGLADIGILWDGRIFWIEVKAADGRLTEAQGRCHQRLWECGCPVVVARSIDDVAGILRSWAIPTRDRIGRAAA